MGILIDTGVFIAWERLGGSVDLVKWSSYGEPAISVITQSELMVGVYRANTPERREKRHKFVQAILANVEIVPVDSEIAEVHAALVANLTASGQAIGPHDNWIAATALAFGKHLLTTNSSEFSRVPNLLVIDYLRRG